MRLVRVLVVGWLATALLAVGGCGLDGEREEVIRGLKVLDEELRSSGRDREADALAKGISRPDTESGFDLLVANTPAMSPTIEPNERFAVAPLGRDGLTRGDVIVFQPTRAALESCGADLASSESLFVKRVVGLPGERVEIRAGVSWIKVGGTRYTAPNAGVNPRQGPDRDSDRATFVVPDGAVLVLGDNRGDSCDSHYWTDPYVPIDNVKGRVLGVYFPEKVVRLVR